MQFDNTYYKLPPRFYANALPARSSAPQLLKLNEPLAAQLGLDFNSLSQLELSNIFSGNLVPAGSNPIALVYAGHQFGHFVPQLGDGRAILLGEVVAPDGCRFDIQLKGSGVTDFSRNGDGRSALGPVIREYILSEAMFHLGVPTTRSLAATLSGDMVYRDRPLAGAILTRVASSHIRIGTFQYFAARGDTEGVQTLLDYALLRHYPEIKNDNNAAALFLRQVAKAQISLVTQWMALGFIHGVMNTDNMTISGETLDYGPCAFMDNFNFDQVFSSIDQNGRYAYMNQGHIALWNLTRLAECLIPLAHPDQKTAVDIINQELLLIPDLLKKTWGERMLQKLGLDNYRDEDEQLIYAWLTYLQSEQLDYTLSFRHLSQILASDEQNCLFKMTPEFKQFESIWRFRLKQQSLDLGQVKNSMESVNPVFIARNHQVERAIKHAEQGDLSIFRQLNQVLEKPFQEQSEFEIFKRAPLPQERVRATFCGT